MGDRMACACAGKSYTNVWPGSVDRVIYIWTERHERRVQTRTRQMYTRRVGASHAHAVRERVPLFVDAIVCSNGLADKSIVYIVESTMINLDGGSVGRGGVWTWVRHNYATYGVFQHCSHAIGGSGTAIKPRDVHGTHARSTDATHRRMHTHHTDEFNNDRHSVDLCCGWPE